MKSLSETWFAEGYIDFELKKYTLLAYLQHVNSYFNQNKLYPQLADIIFHYNNIVAFRENSRFLQEHFPKQLTEVNMKKLQLEYERIIEDSELMKELEDIVHYSAEKIKNTIKNGTEIYEMHDEKYRGIRTDFINQWIRSVSNSAENIKAELIRSYPQLPNPAVYNIETPLAYPMEETLLPIAK